MILQPHQQRVIDERGQLDERVDKLSAFLDSEMFKTLDVDEQRRLIVQLAFMVQYLNTLTERIAHFK